MFWYITWLPNLVPAILQAPSFWVGMFQSIFPFLIPIALAFILFRFPRSVSNKLITGSALNTNPELIKSLEVLALRLIGIFYLFRGSVDLAYHISKVAFNNTIYQSYGIENPPSGWTVEIAASMASTLVELGFSAWLTFGAYGISSLIARIRGRNDL